MENLDYYLSDALELIILNKYILERDHSHEKNVANIALEIFDCLKENNNMTFSERSLLKHSAMLHDIGYYINKTEHNEHSKYLILNDSLFDNIPWELRIKLGTLCENHRKSELINIDYLDPNSKESLIRLIAILKIADALDHKIVRDIIYKPANEKNNIIQVYLNNLSSPNFIKKLSKKSLLFNEIFNINILDSILIV